MIEQTRPIWTSDIVSKMHLFNIKQKTLAEYMGLSTVYVNEVLNGKKKPKDGQERFGNALNELIKERS